MSVRLLDAFGVTILYLNADPPRELLSDYGVEKVHEPGSRQRISVFLVRHVLVHLLVLFYELPHRLDGDGLVEGSREHRHVGCLDVYGQKELRFIKSDVLTLLFAADQVLQEIYGD